MQQYPTIPQNDTPVDPEEPEIITGTGAAPKKREGLRSILSTLVILIAAPLIAITLITFVFQSYEVDGPSMENTLQDRDRLIVLKWPKTWAGITGNDYIPDRYQIIVFTKRGSFSFETGADRQLIKRVIGLPGDRVVVTKDDITIYNDQNPNGFSPDIEGGYKSLLGSTANGNDVDITVGPNEIFVAGDNRANSSDSRSFGPVPLEDVVGELAFRIFPFKQVEGF
jgi:signal peptidase I